MASIHCRKDTGLLLLDFCYQGLRCREHTLLPDTPSNRMRLQKLLERLERAIVKGTFSYAEFFPDSPRAGRFRMSAPANFDGANQKPLVVTPAVSSIPAFSEFAELWFVESEPRWRKRHRQAMRDTLDKIFLPTFGARRLNEIDRAQLLGFRAEIAKRRGRAGQSLSGKRINKLMAQLKAILNEGCDRHGLTSPARGIKPLKQKRSEVLPFTLEEVALLVSTVREDYRPYLQVRLLTGLRTGEADGLQWSDINFEKNTLSVERTLSRDGDGDTKNEGSKRMIPLLPQVRLAFLDQKQRAVPDSPLVFHSNRSNPIDSVNFTNRVWYPLLRHLGLKLRPPYQMRHTAATLMLAAGENPEWVASILGHSTTEMLFRVYSRFIPNLTRNDGRAYAGLLHSQKAAEAPTTPESVSTAAVMSGLSREQKAALLAALTAELN